MQNNEQIKKRVVRFIFGIAVAILFIIFAIISISCAPHSSDVTNGYEPYKNYHRGVERVVETAAPVVEQPVVTVDTQPAADESVSTETEVVEETITDTRPEVIKASAANLPAPPEIDITSWEYMLVNTEHLISSDYEPPEIVYINMLADDRDKPTAYDGNRLPVDSRIADALLDMAEGCKNAGIPVYLSSGYRSYNEQQMLLDRKINQGYDYATAITIVAEPGSSEHQTGICCDITDYYRELKDSSLEDTDTYKWLCAHCTEYGFIVRYPASKSGDADSVTGIIYEPWHFRYVGVEAAKYITENDLSLEEFVALYE